MSSVACPECANSLTDWSDICSRCGWSRYRPSAASLSIRGDGAVAVDSAAATYPLFPVATHKFIVLTLCSFGIYELYWCYQNWRRISDATNEALSPLWRALFSPLWGFSLFGRIWDLAAADGIRLRWSPAMLATIYLVMHLPTWVLPDNMWWIGLATFLPMIPVQAATVRINWQRIDTVTEDPNHRYTPVNVIVICVGGLLLALVAASSMGE